MTTTDSFCVTIQLPLGSPVHSGFFINLVALPTTHWGRNRMSSHYTCSFPCLMIQCPDAVAVVAQSIITVVLYNIRNILPPHHAQPPFNLTSPPPLPRPALPHKGRPLPIPILPLLIHIPLSASLPSPLIPLGLQPHPPNPKTHQKPHRRYPPEHPPSQRVPLRIHMRRGSEEGAGDEGADGAAGGR